MVQDLAPNTSHPSFGDPVLPRRLDARPFGFQTRRLQKRRHVSIEFRVVVEDYVSVRGSFGKRFAQLLDDPIRRRVLGHVAVQDPSSPMLDDEEAVQQLERQSGHGEEVEGRDHLAVVLQKGQPALARIALAANPAQIPSHGSFRDLETELLQFAVDLRCAPADILLCHPVDEIANLPGDPRPAASRSGSPAPVEMEAGAVPTDDGLGLDDEQDVGPPGPKAVEGCPDEPIEGVEFGPPSLPFEHGDLLPEGEDFEGRVAATAEEYTDHGEDGEDKFRHELTLVTRCNVGPSRPAAETARY